MTLVTLISTTVLTLVFLMARTLDLNFVDIVGIRVLHYLKIHNHHSLHA